MSHTFRKTAVAVLLGASLLGGAVTVQAQSPNRQNRCEQRIRQAEANLQRAIARHGERSRQAARRRRELEEVRAHCGA